MEQDKLLDKVSKKTNVSKQDILALANDLQTKDLNDEDNIKEFVQKIAHMTNKQVSDQQMSKIISVIQNNQIPANFNDMV
ncbi:MAG: stage VI sporulation protein F [Erysipelotrichaceae bacterium]|nr:stage VI sporulation protein F [Erysipelotrichaceae bacterium]